MVLAACSQYFDVLLAENPCKHPIIILPQEIKFWTVQALVEFMYKGQVNVSQSGLPDLVKTGDLLQIRGLCNTDITSGLSTQPSLQAGETNKKPSTISKNVISSSTKEDAQNKTDTLTSKSDEDTEKNEPEPDGKYNFKKSTKIDILIKRKLHCTSF